MTGDIVLLWQGSKAVTRGAEIAPTPEGGKRHRNEKKSG